MLAHRTALLIIRVWVEEGSLEPLRANIRRTTDISTGFQPTITLARPDAVEDAVGAWLREVQAT